MAYKDRTQGQQLGVSIKKSVIDNDSLFNML